MSGHERQDPPGALSGADGIARLQALLRELGAGSPDLVRRVESMLAGLQARPIERLGHDELIVMLSDLGLLEVELGQELANLRDQLGARLSFDRADRAYRGQDGGTRR